MPRHEHRLRADRHAAFLAEGHADPLSGVAFRPGNVVVACAHCGRLNRVDLSRLADGPRCGACGRASEPATRPGFTVSIRKVPVSSVPIRPKP